MIPLLNEQALRQAEPASLPVIRSCCETILRRHPGLLRARENLGRVAAEIAHRNRSAGQQRRQARAQSRDREGAATPQSRARQEAAIPPTARSRSRL